MVWTVAADRLQRDRDPVPFVSSPHHGRRITPTAIILHDTAGRLSPGSSVAWFRNPKSRVSAHLVIERDGSVTQMVDFDVSAWHAGRSSFKGRSGCNAFAIGIEIVNPGKLASNGAAWFGEVFENATMMATPEHGRGYWMPYTDAQIEAVKGIVAALVKAYPTINEPDDIVRHCDVSPGRKVDVNPLFPLSDVRLCAFPTTAPLTDPWPLRMGSRGETVRLLQGRLADLGYDPGVIDGMYGAKTRSAVRAWEDENVAHNDGMVNEDEYGVIMALTAKAAPEAPATESKRMAATSASHKIERTAVLGGGATTLLMATDSLWSAVSDGLTGLVGMVGQFKALDMTISTRILAIALVLTLSVILIRWARQARQT